MVAVAESALALLTYTFLFRVYEKRKINELSTDAFWKNAVIGFATGLGLQSIFVLIIYLTGNYSVIRINPVSSLIPCFAAALTAGFVGEIVIRGIFFRLVEDKLGTVLTLTICVLLFAVMHLSAKGASVLSVSSTAIEAGLLLSAGYIFGRNLWLPIFLHFAWRNRRCSCNYNYSQLHHRYGQTVCRHLNEASCGDKDRHQPFGRIPIRELPQGSLL